MHHAKRINVASELGSDGVTAFATTVSRHVNVGGKLRRYRDLGFFAPFA